ncbi:expressed unknown protein [Seminavis robusta]|uniref:Uncharacterized protein n=1 Tax=Seminavis robusta TaxID=568900 RepID=A0A9N8EC06_9STRA|nr:expressed unknown protein [Seminavis robusta]|eukprot:Sro949_g223640.1 n/a (415) ;mRNA; r:13049-14293
MMADIPEILKAIPDVKAQRVCWGCQMLERVEEPFKGCCNRCHDEGFIPALFCSQNCYMKAWPRHKEWHEEAVPKKEKLKQESESMLRRGIQSHSQFVNLMNAAAVRAVGGDLNGGKKLLRKAQKIDPSRAETIDFIASCFFLSGQDEEGIACTVEACGRFALAALTGNRGAERIEGNQITEVLCQWAHNVAFLGLLYAKPKKLYAVQKPTWWCHDGLLKRITKVGLDAYAAMLSDPDVFNTLMDLRAMALSGFEFDESIPSNRTAEELREAAALLWTVSQFDASVHAPLYKARSELVMKVAALRSAEEGKAYCSALEKGEAGLWVVLYGLKCETESPMNNKFGVVCVDGLEEGRVAVKVDGISDAKRIPPRNLWEVPFSELHVALISTLDDTTQWKYIRGSRELSLARSMAEQR